MNCTNQPEVGQYDLVALTKGEQRLLKAAPMLLLNCKDALNKLCWIACELGALTQGDKHCDTQTVRRNLAAIIHEVEDV